MVRGLKIRIKEIEGLYYLCSKQKVLISCMVIGQLICTIVFAYAKSRFSHKAADLKCLMLKIVFFFTNLQCFELLKAIFQPLNILHVNSTMYFD